MQIVLQFGTMGQNLICLNHCSMYLQATFLSNICNGMGTASNPRMWDGKAQCNSNYRWPRMDKPSAAEWQEWRGMLMSNSEFRIQSWMMMKMTKKSKYWKRNKEKEQRRDEEEKKESVWK